MKLPTFNESRTFLGVIIVLTLFPYWCHCQSITSPDGALTVSHVRIGIDSRIRIKGADFVREFETWTEPWHIEWNAASDAFMYVQHISGGSVMAVCWFDGKKWRMKVLEPVLKGTFSYEVSDCSFGPHGVSLVYKLRRETGNGTIIGYSRSTVKFDYKKRQNVISETRDISEEQYNSMIAIKK